MMQNMVKLSKFLSLVLRHDPERIGLLMDPAGWADVDELIQRAGAAGIPLTRALLDKVVAESDKQRFAFSEDGRKVRASQGHSIDVDLGLVPIAPPPRLYHGTATRFLDAIRAEGLKPGGRHHVHLSADTESALRVGRRHGKPVVLMVSSARMVSAGRSFYRSANGVWLTDHVPPEFIQFP